MWLGRLCTTNSIIDTRIKATLTSTMYDMSRVTAYGYNDIVDEKGRYEERKQYNNQRTIDYKNKKYTLLSGNPESAPKDAPQFLIDYINYYKKRGYHKRSLGSNNGFAFSALSSLMNTHLFSYISEIKSAVLMIHGEKAHSLYFSKDAFSHLKGDNKELYIIPNACHTDLYDNMEKIPFDKIETFFNKYLK